MGFTLLGPLTQVRVIARGHGIRELARLNRRYGRARWRKCAGIAQVLLPDGDVQPAEIHWYEASGLGRHELKIKRYLA